MILPRKLRWLYKTSQTMPTTLPGRCQHRADGLLSSSSKQHTSLRALWLAHFAPGSVCTCNFSGRQSRPLVVLRFRFSRRVSFSARAPDDSSLRPFTAVRTCSVKATTFSAFFTWLAQRYPPLSFLICPSPSPCSSVPQAVPSLCCSELYPTLLCRAYWSTLSYFGLKSC